MFTNILLCTHGSKGAQKAEAYVFETLLKKLSPEKLNVLTIIDKDWSGMSSDDWLNTSTTRTQFKDYVQEQLSREIDDDWQRIRSMYDVGEDCRFLKVVGGIEETIAEVAEKLGCDLIIIGPYNKKPRRLTSVVMEKGLADTISNKVLHPLLPCPVLIAP
jgi:nucleotide-binding universal stress UspA family protein